MLQHMYNIKYNILIKSICSLKRLMEPVSMTDINNSLENLINALKERILIFSEQHFRKPIKRYTYFSIKHLLS